MRNWQRWFLSILLGFGCGAGAAAMDPQASLRDILRHGIGGALPCMVALKMTINQDERPASTPPPDRSMGAAA